MVERWKESRSDTRLPQSPVGGQGPFSRSPEHFGKSNEAKDRENIRKVKKVKCDRLIDRPTDGWTDGQNGV